MTSCWACETELHPSWKFCVQCGVPVEIDNDTTINAHARKPLTPIAIFGWIFAGIGVVLIAIGIVVFVRAAA